jgi:hypothetical protein
MNRNQNIDTDKYFILFSKIFLNQENYQFEKAYGQYINEKRLTHVYIKNGMFLIQLAIFYQRGTFNWIGASDQSNYPKKWFGDTSRAMHE